MRLLNPRIVFSEYLSKLTEKNTVPHEQFMVMVTRDLNTGQWLGNYCIITDDIETITRQYEPLLQHFDIPQTVHFARTFFEGEQPLLCFIHDEQTHLSAILIPSKRPKKVAQQIENFSTDM